MNRKLRELKYALLVLTLKAAVWQCRRFPCAPKEYYRDAAGDVGVYRLP